MHAKSMFKVKVHRLNISHTLMVILCSYFMLVASYLVITLLILISLLLDKIPNLDIKR